MTSTTPFNTPHSSARPSSLRSLPSLDIAAVLAPAGAFENLELLTTSLSFTDTSSGDKCNLEDAPPFPKDHRPPIFIIQDHRAQISFAVRPGVISLGDIHADEQAARNVLSAPTIPRMNLVMKEQLFMKTWIEKLTPHRPPRHVPWTSDKPVPRQEWISEGSIFSAETIQSRTRKIPHTRTAQHFANWPCPPKVTAPHSAHCIQDHREAAVIPKERFEHLAGSKRCPVYALESGPDALIHGRKEKRGQCSLVSPIPKPCSDRRTKRPYRDASRPLPQLGSIPSIAIRRGKKVSCLQLKEVDNMTYPDLPTPFRSSPTVWSPKFDSGIFSPDEELFTDHYSMLSSLRSQYAALGSGISTPVTYESQEWQAVSMHLDMNSVTSKLSFSTDDEWAFQKDLAVVTKDLHGPVDNTPDVPPPLSMCKIAPDRLQNSLNDCCSSYVIPIRSASPHPRSEVPFVRVSSAPLNDPPCTTLPSCPILIDPSIPPCVRGTLKNVKSVRFENVSHNQDTGLLVTPAQERSTAAKRPSPLRNSFTAPLSAADVNKSSDMATEARPKPKGDQVPAIKKPRIMKSKLVPKSTILKPHHVSEVSILRRVDTNVRREIPPTPGLDKPAAPTIGRHSHVANENGRTILTHAPKPWSTMNGNDLRISVHGGAPKIRLTTPLRNIFKFN
ncbi:hypothetical protein AZE42_01155 [Rhizopogon vesiculosus]|uniref:Uncharacterized protein n=1 Tax=Rhizopogon vesiculosus TaxID=180088 RepID=A0A1J8QCS7_9AGAM|nr:hypothetical protein AZE42_01155 [Rhizopogon vesiculosus]